MQDCRYTEFETVYSIPSYSLIMCSY